MAKVFSLVQGLTPNNDHESEIIKLIQSPWAKEVVISVAFVMESGVSKIETELKNRSNLVTIFAGISNGITSKQALSKLLKIGIKIYAIDIGTKAFLYHPKVYAAIGDEKATTIIGSANLTSRGINSNIEVSSRIELDLNDSADRLYIKTIIEPFYNLIGKHTKNVFEITTQNQIDDLLNEGRLEDESFKKQANVTGTKSPNTKSVTIPVLPTHHKKTKRKSKVNSKPLYIQPNSNKVNGWVWSKNLASRDLGNPTPNTSSKTNSTAELGLSQGNLRGKIDQTTYFRNIIFSNLKWICKNKTNKHLYTSNADFELVIDGIFLGNFNLELTHNTDNNYTTFTQSNIVTRIKWGPLTSTVKNVNLLNRVINLYYLGNNKYQLEIV